MVHLISARHTFSTFLFRYQENGGLAIDYDLVVNHKVDLPAAKKEEPVAAKLEREPRMERLDPNEWKKQDHYMVLGIEEKRGQVCSPEDIRNAYRARVLVYHPDKIAQRAGEGKGKRQKDDAIFKCIQKAFETLNDPDKKEAFDHVDPTFDNSIPEEKLPAGACFYATYGPVFERNLKFSKKATSLALGDASTPRDQVEAFYQFWFDFDSIRRFDYLDEDDCETGDNRADKRWQEKKNKAARAKRKTEDNTRLRMLAENAYKADPRIKAFKEADKLAKLNKKTQKPTGPAATSSSSSSSDKAAKAAAEAEKKKAEEAEAKAREEALKAAKAAREAEANALRKERKAFKALFAEHSYFVPTVGIDAASKLKMMEEEAALVEQVCQKLDKLALGQCREEIAALAGEKANFARVTNVLRDRLGVAPVPVVPVATAAAAPPVQVQEEPKSLVTAAEEDWSVHDTDLLINGAKKFPGGTRNRWETITEWFNRQAEVPRDMDALLRKSNSLKSSTATPGAAPIEADPMASLVSAAKRDPRINQNEPTLAISSTDAHIPWSGEETLALQAAIKSVPADDPQRWDAVASLVPSRTKKECMLRAKELATMLKKKSTSE